MDKSIKGQLKKFILILLILSAELCAQEVKSSNAGRISSNPCKDSLLVELEQKYLIAKDSMTVQEKRLLILLEKECDEYTRNKIEEKFEIEENTDFYGQEVDNNNTVLIISAILAIISLATLVYLVGQ
jgi:hypothetical protein